MPRPGRPVTTPLAALDRPAPGKVRPRITLPDAMARRVQAAGVLLGVDRNEALAAAVELGLPALEARAKAAKEKSAPGTRTGA